MKLLEAALATFARFGFRKTSMEEVARAAHISRQGLYLHYKTKEELFRATVEHAVTTALAAAIAAIDGARSVEAKLAAAFDEWTGRYVGLIGANVTDLHDAIATVDDIITTAEEEFLAVVVDVLRDSKLPGAHKLTARQLAESLAATARGLKTSCTTRDEFAERFAITVRVMCRPLALRA